MDPLSIIASIIAVAQATDRIVTLAVKIKRYLSAPEEISALITEIADLGLVLAKLQSSTTTFPLQELPTLKKLLDSCNNIMLQIEQLIKEMYVKSANSKDSVEPRFWRLAWSRKKAEVDRLSQQLRDYKALLTLQLVGVNTIVPPDAEIAICIREGHLERIKELFANGFASPADIIGPYGMTTLSLAINYGQFEVCKLLIGIGAHQYAPKTEGRVSDIFNFWSKYHLQDRSLPASVLIVDMFNLCATDRHLEALHHSLSGPFQESGPFSRLHKSVLGISIEPIEKVIRESREYMNDADILGRTALHWAVCQLDANIVERILCCGADPDIKDRDGKAPLHLAAGLGDAEVAASLVAAGANLELQDCHGNTPIQLAAMRGHTSIIELLLDAGSNIESTNAFRETPLMSACLANQAQSVDVLCNRGSNIEHVSDHRITPLGYGIKVNGYEVVQILLRKQALTNIIPYHGKTFLHLAAQGADKKMLELLASSSNVRVDVEALDDKGYTALQYLSLRPDGNALLMAFEALVRRAGRIGSKEVNVGSNQAGNDMVEDFFDAVEFQ